MKSFTVGGVRLCMSIQIDSQEMAGWSTERIDRFFRGIATVQAAVDDKVPDHEVLARRQSEAMAEQHMALVRVYNGLPPFREVPTYEQRVAAWLDSIPGAAAGWKEVEASEFGKAEAEWVLEVLDMHGGNEAVARAAVVDAIRRIVARRTLGSKLESAFDETVEAACFASRNWWLIGIARLQELNLVEAAE